MCAKSFNLRATKVSTGYFIFIEHSRHPVLCHSTHISTAQMVVSVSTSPLHISLICFPLSCMSIHPFLPSSRAQLWSLVLELKSLLYHLLALGSWASPLTSLCLSILISKVGGKLISLIDFLKIKIRYISWHMVKA